MQEGGPTEESSLQERNRDDPNYTNGSAPREQANNSNERGGCDVAYSARSVMTSPPLLRDEQAALPNELEESDQEWRDVPSVTLPDRLLKPHPLGPRPRSSQSRTAAGAPPYEREGVGLGICAGDCERAREGSGVVVSSRRASQDGGERPSEGGEAAERSREVGVKVRSRRPVRDSRDAR